MKEGLLKKMSDWLDSEEGKASMETYAKKLISNEQTRKRQYERLNRDYAPRFDELMNKLLEKYDSSAYRDKWYNRGFMPPEHLLFFLHDYAETYGQECTDEEYKEHGNMFTSSMFKVHGWIFLRMDGQGSVIKAFKIP